MPETLSKKKRTTPAERRRAMATFLVGATVTLLVALADIFGLLDPLERMAYDSRAKHFQFFTPPPSDRIVHLDVDDASLNAIGEWPWPRAKLARLLEELNAQKPDLVFLDIIFPNESPFNSEGSNDDDLQFANTIEEMGNVLIPVHFFFTPTEARSPFYELVAREVSKHPQISLTDLSRVLLDAGWNLESDDSQVIDSWIIARRKYAQLQCETILSQKPDASWEEVSRIILQTDQLQSVDARWLRLIEKQYERAKAIRAFDRFTLPLSEIPSEPFTAFGHGAPIDPLGAAATAGAFVDSISDPDGVTRTAPAVVGYRSRAYLQVAVALAAHYYGADWKDIRWETDRIVIPRESDPPVSIPLVDSQSSSTGVHGSAIRVPWFGPRDAGWVNMFDRGATDERRQHVPMTKLWQSLQLKERQARNFRQVDEAVLGVLVWLNDPARFETYKNEVVPTEDIALREQTIREILEHQDILFAVEQFEQMQSEGEELKPDEELFLGSFKAFELLKPIFSETQNQLIKDIDQLQRELRSDFEGKIVLVGFTATALVKADVKQTSLHAEAPGVIVHGTLLNGILTGELWRDVPRWFGPTIAILLGICATLAAVLLAPLSALILIGSLFVGYTVLNTVVLFDYANWVTPISVQWISVGAVWAICAFYRYSDERRRRARITSRFRSYVDPALVNYYLEHPDQTSLAGETRIITVAFTDLEGFTAISERLKGETVPLLNEYMARMVPVIRENGGYLNKFLGDGIMFFFGAPIPNENHARDAVNTVWQMQQELEQFNQLLRERDLPQVSMRVGVLTGEVVVGDAGSISAQRPEDRASDYTVLGDNVNTASRLEGANKATGTYILLAESTAEQVRDEYLLRPIARLQVVGKTEGVMTFEPLAPIDEATNEQKELAALTIEVVDQFCAAQWDECRNACDRLDAAFGPCKLTTLYRNACQEHEGESTHGFTGSIVLTEK